jgi:uncharacterized protein GlcG (DUF336 family)
MALTRDRARECIERGLVEARALGFNVAIAVVDDAGHLVVCDRMDGALWVTPEIARAKANAAAAFHATTRDLEERSASASSSPTTLRRSVTIDSSSAEARSRWWRTGGSSARWA